MNNTDKRKLLLSAKHLSREFGKERFPAVQDISLSIHAGEVFALVGPNGAGKTTTVRMCSTLLTPTSGALEVAGVDAKRHPQEARRQIGLVLGGETGFYPRASAKTNLLFFADVAGMSGSKRRSEVQMVLERVGLADRQNDKVGSYSHGMWQRLHIARALLGSPSLLLFDEPTSGLDPDVALEMRDLVASLAQQGVGVLLTSHSMSEVEELAEVIAVIGAGRVAVLGQVADIAAYAGLEATTSATLPARAVSIQSELESAVGSSGDISMRAKGAGWSLNVRWNRDVEAGVGRLLHVLENAGFAQPDDLLTRPANLEDSYLAISDGLRR